MNLSGVYCIRNSINNKIYIGSSIDIYARWKLHKKQLQNNIHGNYHLQKSWNKYGINSFTFNTLIICELNELLYYEQQCLDIFSPEYNICKKAGSQLGTKRTSKSREKMSLSAKIRASRPEEHERLRLQASGKSPSVETRQKLSLTSSTFWRTPENRKFMSDMKKGRIVSDKTRMKLSLANKGKKPTPQTIDAVRRAHIGKHLSNETKKKKSESNKKWFIIHPQERKRISEFMKTREVTQETREKLRISNTGKKHSLETIEKIRQNSLSQWAKRKSSNE